MSSRLPSEEADQYFLGEYVQPSTVNVWLPIRYGLSVIMLAQVVRQHVDSSIAVGSNSPVDSGPHLIEGLFETFINQLHPSMGLSAPFSDTFYIESRAKDTEQRGSKDAHIRVEIDRWLLHHQIFYAILQLSSSGDETPITKACVAFSRHILAITDRIRGRCTVIDSLRYVVILEYLSMRYFADSMRTSLLSHSMNAAAPILATSVLISHHLAQSSYWLDFYEQHHLLSTARTFFYARKSNIPSRHGERLLKLVSSLEAKGRSPLASEDSSTGPDFDSISTMSPSGFIDPNLSSSLRDGTLRKTGNLETHHGGVNGSLDQDFLEWFNSLPPDSSVSSLFALPR